MTGEQGAFLLMMVLGAGSLLLWDFLYEMRSAWNMKPWMVNILDFAWWCGVSSMITAALWQTAQLRVRMHEAIAFFIGAVLYHITVSRVLKSLFYVIFNIILKIVQFIFKILLTPARFLYKILLGLFLPRGRSGRGGLRKKDAADGV